MNLLFFSLADYPLFFVFWNLFLALIPFWISGYLYRFSSIGAETFPRFQRIRFWSLFIVWFFFFPNTAYLFTEVRHLLDYCPSNYYEVCWQGLWQIPFFFTYSVLGLPLFYLSLRRMSLLLSRFKKWLIHFPVFMIPMTSIGLLFGTVDRFNSWEVITKPFSLIQTALGYFTDPEKFIGFFSFTVSLYVVYYGINFLLKCYNHKR